MPLTDSDLPMLYHAADSSSLAAQKRFLIATAIRLVALVGAAAFGLATWRFPTSATDWAGVLAGVCFSVALVTEVYLLRTRPERTWYEGRAAAESVKTLSWRYAVGGEPFNIDGRETIEVERLFLNQLNEVIEVVRGLELTVPASAGEQISNKMRAVRGLSLEERKATYADDRVKDQQSWYQRKATWNRQRANRWTLGMLLAEVAGVIAAILKAIGVISGAVLGFAGAIVAAMTAWQQTKQHGMLASAYSVTAIELASIRTKVTHQQNENDWAKFVGDAEEAFSREHTLWKASRGVRSL